MPDTSFPGTAFAWGFYLVLVAITLVASYTDIRRMVVPKWLTLPALAVGVLLNVARFALQDEHTALEGLWFSFKGFGIGFGLFFIMFVLGTCRGGDVKLFGALGAWLGLQLTLFVLAGTVILVLVFTVVRGIWRLVHGPAKPLAGKPGMGKRSAGPLSREEYEAQKRLRRRMVYSPALAIATILMLLWFYRNGLGLHAAQVKEEGASRPQAAQKA